ncbi:hypothetical protein SprV_0902730300 [Sparganum proliferum]
MVVPLSTPVWIDSPGGRKQSLCLMPLLERSSKLSLVAVLPSLMQPPLLRLIAVPNLNLNPSSLFSLFRGCTRIRTTAHHPATNGMVERFHRQLKASLRAAEDPENWKDHFSLVLLVIRSSLKSYLDCSAAELVFGATVRLPRQVISPTLRVAVEDPTSLLHRLRQFMWTFSPIPPKPSVSESYLE